MTGAVFLIVVVAGLLVSNLAWPALEEAFRAGCARERPAPRPRPARRRQHHHVRVVSPPFDWARRSPELLAPTAVRRVDVEFDEWIADGLLGRAAPPG